MLRQWNTHIQLHKQNFFSFNIDFKKLTFFIQKQKQHSGLFFPFSGLIFLHFGSFFLALFFLHIGSLFWPYFFYTMVFLHSLLQPLFSLSLSFLHLFHLLKSAGSINGRILLILLNLIFLISFFTRPDPWEK